MKKSFILGLATGVVLTGASLVLANSQIQAILNDQIKVTLNGQIQEFKDETTNETQYPITYNNRTYLPLRTVANLVGVDVDYDANNNTAILANNNNSLTDKNKKCYLNNNVLSIIEYGVSDPGIEWESINNIYIDKEIKELNGDELIELTGNKIEDIKEKVKKYLVNKYSVSDEDAGKFSGTKYFINSKGNLSCGTYPPNGAGSGRYDHYDLIEAKEFDI